MVWLPGIERARTLSERFEQQALEPVRVLARRVAHLMSSPCSVYLLDRDRRFLVPAAAVDEHARSLAHTAATAHVLSTEEPVYHRLLKETRPCVLRAAVGQEPRGIESHVEPGLVREGIASVLLVPLVLPLKGRSSSDEIGLVAVFRRRVGPSEARDVTFLVRIVDETAAEVAKGLSRVADGQVEAPLTTRVQPLMRALVRAGSSVEVATAMVDAAVGALGADGAAVVSFTRSRAATVLATDRIDDDRAISLADPAIVTNALTVVEGPNGVDVVVPMHSGERELARLILSYPSEDKIDRARKELIRTVVRQGANALVRTRAFDAERDAWLRLAHISVASDKLSSTIEWDETLQNIGQIFVPEIASACAIDLDTDDGPERIFVHPRDPSPSARSLPLETGGVRIGTFVVDITAGDSDDQLLLGALASRVAMALESARLFRQLQVAVQVRDEFVSIASHELKTPLTALKMCMFGLERFGGGPDRTVSLAARQVRRLEILVEQLLDVSRIRAGRLELDVASVDLSALAYEAAELLPGRKVEVKAPEPVFGRWDRSRISQVLVNLLGNAVKYGNDQPIEVVVTTNDDRAVVAVRDRGIGIEEQALERIFDRFERAVSSKNFGGFGLGLWISREIVRAHGGSIHARSALGNGSEFVVELPRAV